MVYKSVAGETTTIAAVVLFALGKAFINIAFPPKRPAAYFAAARALGFFISQKINAGRAIFPAPWKVWVWCLFNRLPQVFTVCHLNSVLRFRSYGTRCLDAFKPAVGKIHAYPGFQFPFIIFSCSLSKKTAFPAPPLRKEITKSTCWAEILATPVWSIFLYCFCPDRESGLVTYAFENPLPNARCIVPESFSENNGCNNVLLSIGL